MEGNGMEKGCLYVLLLQPLSRFLAFSLSRFLTFSVPPFSVVAAYTLLSRRYRRRPRTHVEDLSSQTQSLPLPITSHFLV
jgi:hypothetical protein